MVMRRRRPSDASQGKAEVLVEALPWINEWAGSTFVVKYGGSAMEDDTLRAKVIEDVLLLKLMGVHVVLVHGGGKDISSLSDRLNLSVRFKDGLRVTDEDTMEVVQMVLVGKVNAELVQAINGYGNHAVGISGADGRTLRACQLDPELGRVGRVTEVNPDLALKVLDDGYIPVIAGVGFGEDGGPYNVNADFAASHIAHDTRPALEDDVGSSTSWAPSAPSTTAAPCEEGLVAHRARTTETGGSKGSTASTLTDPGRRWRGWRGGEGSARMRRVLPCADPRG